MYYKYLEKLMKNAVVSVILAGMLIAAVLCAGCETTPPGDVITEEKDFVGFTYVDVGSAFEVDITRSDSFSVIISADESLFDYIEVFKEGQTLKLYLMPHHIFTDFTLGVKTLKAEITMPALYGLSLSGASKGELSGFKSSNDFTLNVSGASVLEMADIEVGFTESTVSGASRISGNITARDVTFEVSGASSAELSGSAEDLVLTVSGSSRADLTSLRLNSADVELSGASEATVNVKGRLDINVSGASRLYFIGNPDIGETNLSGASTIKHK